MRSTSVSHSATGCLIKFSIFDRVCVNYLIVRFCGGIDENKIFLTYRVSVLAIRSSANVNLPVSVYLILQSINRSYLTWEK